MSVIKMSVKQTVLGNVSEADLRTIFRKKVQVSFDKSSLQILILGEFYFNVLHLILQLLNHYK